MKEELLTIREFANRAGVSRQAIYSKLENDLSPFLVTVDNTKMLKTEALLKFSVKSINSHETVKKEDQLTHSLQQTINILQEQIKVKDSQIEVLQRLLEQQQQLHAAQISLPEKSSATKKSWQFWKSDK